MIILLTESKLFSEDPDIRFSKACEVPVGTWKEMWRRHSILGYTRSELGEYLMMKTGKTIPNQTIKRWINKTRIYMKAKHAIDMGVNSVNSNFFDELEWFVVKESLKNLKSSVKKKPKILP